MNNIWNKEAECMSAQANPTSFRFPADTVCSPGLGAHYGSEYLGALTIPASGGNTARQVKLMKDLGTNILC